MTALIALPLILSAICVMATIIELQSAHRLSPRVWRCSRLARRYRDTIAPAGAHSEA